MKWQWFLGGEFMFWMSIILFITLIIGFIITYIVDPVAIIQLKVQKTDPTSIQKISEKYVDDLGITINKKIVYRFVKYKYNRDFAPDDPEDYLYGTFHEWNNTYYIDISMDLYGLESLEEVVIHETRHMIIEYLKDEKIIDLIKYSEEIASDMNSNYNNLFDSGIYLLKKSYKP